MDVSKEISFCLEKQSVSILEESDFPNSIQDLNPQKFVLIDEVGSSMLNKGHQTIQEKMLLPGEKCSDLGNSCFKFCLKSNSDSHLETTSNSEKVYRGNYIKGKDEGNQSSPFQIIKNQSDCFEANLPDSKKNKTIETSEKSIIPAEKNQSETIQLMKSLDEETSPMARRNENREAASPMLNECTSTTKTFPLKPELEVCMGNPYIDFIFNCRYPTSNLSVNGNSEELYPSNSVKERKMDAKGLKKGADIFGNRLTSKDRNKLKVICPHCTKKVPAPGFVRHLSYCMRARIRKSRRRP